MMPGENAPPIHPNDHCSTAAHADRKDFDAWLDAKAEGGTDKSDKEQGNINELLYGDVYHSNGFDKYTVNQLLGRNIKFKTGGASIDEYISQVRSRALNNSKTDEEKLKELIESGKVSNRLRWGKQNEHIPGTKARERRLKNDARNNKTPSSEFLEGINVPALLREKRKNVTIELKSDKASVYFDVEDYIGKVYNLGERKYQNVKRVKLEYTKSGKHAYPVKDW